MEKTEKYIDNLKRKITVHYFNGNVQYQYDGKLIKHVITEAKFRIKMTKEAWKSC